MEEVPLDDGARGHGRGQDHARAWVGEASPNVSHCLVRLVEANEGVGVGRASLHDQVGARAHCLGLGLQPVWSRGACTQAMG